MRRRKKSIRVEPENYRGATFDARRRATSLVDCKPLRP
jgi:hypothetical protein